MAQFKKKEKIAEEPEAPKGRNKAEEYAFQRKLKVLSKKEGELLVGLLQKSGIKFYHSEFEALGIIKIREGDKIVVDLA